jgi:transcriptional regulator with XRE-family HTH domain
MNQIDLARATGLAQGFLSDLENGRRAMTEATAGRLAAALGIDVTLLAA